MKSEMYSKICLLTGMTITRKTYGGRLDTNNVAEYEKGLRTKLKNTYQFVEIREVQKDFKS